MRLLLDENASDRRFIRLLEASGHDVETTIGALGAGASDRSIFDRAISARRVIVTRDCSDFRELAAFDTAHPGLLLIYAGSMRRAEALVRAIDRIATMYSSLQGMVLSVTDFAW